MGHEALGRAEIEPFEDVGAPEGDLRTQRTGQAARRPGRHGIERRDGIGLQHPPGHRLGEILAETRGKHPHQLLAGHRF